MAAWRKVGVALAAALLIGGGPVPTVAADDPAADTIVVVDATGRFTAYEGLEPGAEVTTWFFGNPGDVPLVGDWDCDGSTTPAMFRPGNGFVYLRNDLAPGPAEDEFFFGDPGDVPLVGDFDGDGCDTIGVYRPGSARMFVTNRLGGGRAEYDYPFGNPGDRPFAADFDGDGIDTLGLYRESTGFVYFRNAHTGGVADVEFFYGDPGDRIIAGDWDGDGVDTVAVHRRASGQVLFRQANTPGNADFALDVPGDVTVLPMGPRGSGPPAAGGLPVGFGPGWENTVGAAVDRTATSVELHVDRNHPLAADGNDGSPARPLATIAAAVDLAQDHRRAGRGVRVVVHPGTYREGVEIVGPNLAGGDPVLVVEATEPGSVVVSGADVWDGWWAAGGVWVHEWPFDWGLAPIPDGWDAVTVAPIVRRREMVFVDGDPLRQVLSGHGLAPGTFFVDEAADRIRVAPADPAGFAAASVEVAVRPEALRVLLTDRVVIDGIELRHANPALGNAVNVLESTDVVLEDVAIDGNNWGGLQIYDSSGVTVASSSSSHNGGRGVGMADATRVLIDGFTARGNNRRGAAGDFTGWSVAGIKAHHLHDAILRDVDLSANFTRGLWLDTDNTRVLIDGTRACSNLRDGLFVEASQGPVIVHDTVLCGNDGHGLLSANAVGLSLFRSEICGNGNAQVELSGMPERAIDLHATGGTAVLPAAGDWVLDRNRIGSAAGSPVLVGTTLGAVDIAAFATSLASGGNLWRSPVADGFEVEDGALVDFPGWQAITGDDSRFLPSGGSAWCGP